jgi:hypothetical protein
MGIRPGESPGSQQPLKQSGADADQSGGILLAERNRRLDAVAQPLDGGLQIRQDAGQLGQRIDN